MEGEQQMKQPRQDPDTKEWYFCGKWYPRYPYDEVDKFEEEKNRIHEELTKKMKEETDA
jgi:hypothetical protein